MASLLELLTLWPPFGSGDVAGAAQTLIAAIIDRALANPTIAAALPGGLTFGDADEDADEPFGVFSDIGQVDHHNTGPSYWREGAYQLSLFMNSRADAESLAKVFKDEFNHKMAPLVFQDGTHICVWAGPIRHVGEDLGKSGKPLYHAYLEFMCKHNRQLDVS